MAELFLLVALKVNRAFGATFFLVSWSFSESALIAYFKLSILFAIWIKNTGVSWGGIPENRLSGRRLECSLKHR